MKDVDLIAAAQPIIESLEATGRDSAARTMAALCEALERRAWLPLPATPEPGVAPWDGKFVDLWDPLTGSRITDCSWVEFDSYWDSPEGYILDNGQPTHWMPLPNPPPPPGERG